MRQMMVDTCSGSDTHQQSTAGRMKANRTCADSLSSPQSFRDRTLQMARDLAGGIPEEIANRWYAFTSKEANYPRGITLGNFRDFARAFAKKGQTYTNVTAPVVEICDELKRDFYRAELPPLEITEQKVADDECQLQKAEILHDAAAVEEAARIVVADAEILVEAADRAAHVTLNCASHGGTR